VLHSCPRTIQATGSNGALQSGARRRTPGPRGGTSPVTLGDTATFTFTTGVPPLWEATLPQKRRIWHISGKSEKVQERGKEKKKTGDRRARSRVGPEWGGKNRWVNGRGEGGSGAKARGKSTKKGEARPLLGSICPYRKYIIGGDPRERGGEEDFFKIPKEQPFFEGKARNCRAVIA